MAHSSLFGVALCGTLLLGGSGALADQELLKSVLAAIESRRQKMNPIWVRYKLNYWQSASYQRALNRPGVEGDVRWDEDVEIGQKGGKSRSWKRTMGPPRGSAWRSEDFRVYTGNVTISKSNRENVFMLSRKKDDTCISERPWGIVDEETVLGALRSCLSGTPKCDLAVSYDAVLDGQEYVLLEVSFPAARESAKVWLIPEFGWSLRRFERYAGAANLQVVSEATEYEQCDGLPYPKRATRIRYLADGSLGETVTYQLSSVETSARRIPDNLFEVTFPPDALLWDDDLKIMVRNSKVTESHLDEIVRQAGRPATNVRPWLYLLLGVLAAAAVVLWGSRYVRRH